MISDFTPDMKAYFDTLSPIFQETILQSGAKLENIDDIKNFIRHIQSGKK